MNKNLIAPCGMNCALCRAYQRDKNKCPGCNGDDKLKPRYCVSCFMKNCTERKSEFCFDCDKFPCQKVKHIDKRYRTKYHMSMIDNLNMIKEKGITAFLLDQKQKWTCPGCQGIVCVHTGKCLTCQK